MIVLPALAADLYLRIPDTWDAWSDIKGDHYRREGVNILAIDRFGKHWRFDPVRSEWIARIRKTA